MEIEFLPNNSHLRSIAFFKENDPHLMRMAIQPYIFHSPIINQLPFDVPGIYNLGGGRQVGKTTLLKQWMLKLLNEGVTPKAIAFLSCELIVDQHSLYRIVTNQLSEMPEKGMRYLILDEITYVRDWDKAIKYLADINVFNEVVVIISGSDLVMMQDARKCFPGRRGRASVVDFHCYPLSFKQLIQLKHPNTLEEIIQQEQTANQEQMQLLYEEFNHYLIHGGFLTAINEYAETKSIRPSTLATYSDWIRGDVIKRGKQEHFLRELVSAILKHYSSQISWRNLIASLSIDHTQTAIDYISLLMSMDAVFVQMALIEEKLVGAPKKQRKFMFNDPFIFHAMRAWLHPVEDPYTSQIQPIIENAVECGKLVETVAITYCRQKYPTYYIKATNEVDIAYIKKQHFYPIEVKWRNQLHAADLKQISKYKNGKIWAKLDACATIQGLPALPLPLALILFD